MSIVLRPEQVLTETWTATFKRRGFRGPHEATIQMPHHVIWACTGRGADVDTAKIDSVLSLAANIISTQSEDFGYEPVRGETLALLGKVVRAEQRRRKRAAVDDTENLPDDACGNVDDEVTR